MLNTTGLFQRGHHTADFQGSGKLPWSLNALSKITLKRASYVTVRLRMSTHSRNRSFVREGVLWLGGEERSHSWRRSWLGVGPPTVQQEGPLGVCRARGDSWPGPWWWHPLPWRITLEVLCSGLTKNCPLKYYLIQGFTVLKKRGGGPARWKKLGFLEWIRTLSQETGLGRLLPSLVPKRSSGTPGQAQPEPWAPEEAGGPCRPPFLRMRGEQDRLSFE